MNRIKRIWRKLTNYGIDDQLTAISARRIELTNKITVVMTLSFLPSVIKMFLDVGLTRESVIYLFTIIITSAIPAINSLKLYKVAKLVLVFSYLASVALMTSTDGSVGPWVSRGFLLVGLFIPFAIFDDSEKKIALGSAAVMIIQGAFISPIAMFFNPKTELYIATVRETAHIYFITQAVTISMVYRLMQTIDTNILKKALYAAVESEKKYRLLSDDLEKQVRSRTAQLLQSEKLSAIGQMVAGVAHEVNSPRAAVDHYITLTERHVDKVLAIQPLQAEVAVPIGKIKREFIPAMSDAITRIGELTNGLLNFTRAEHKEMKLSDMHQIIDSVEVLLKNQLQDRIEIVKQYGGIPPLVCYPGQMNQVFMNILINAIQAIPDKGKITITTGVNNEKVEIRIKDTGIGMNEETKKKIFDPFFTTKEVGKGTGLGMSIVWEILQKHGADIDVQSEPKEGAEFILRFNTNPGDRIDKS